jgi:hypothetical protein
MEAKTIANRVREAVGMAFNRMDLPPDVVGLIVDVVAAEFGNERTYDPATHICISKGAARCALINMPDSAEGGVSPREHAARAELRAALEVK